MAKIDLRNPGRPIHAGIILMGGVTEILDTAPIDLLHGLTKSFMEQLPLPDELKKQAIDVDFHWVNEKGTPASMTSGITLQTTDSFETCPPLDIVLMGAHWGHTPNETELAFVRKSYQDCSAYLSICGGMMVPLMAGTLKGKTCTGPLPVLAQVKNDNPEVNWVEKRYVMDSDGKTWTSGALLNGLDLMKAFVEHTWGGPGSLAEQVIGIGGWPVRSVEYRGGQ
ncbi:hypothetical protein M409DRAFT_18985 [Zasmidium cellare ATCC 36951]|uniref:DJ-1/PfpI domain-containing protein n=1 Tax=Zasmidium cellare ATCC 36951 TaxID=1080233 RepID=A0A6A6CWC2_ZASCE|nr:uncharacterized protein M409DRAFT_18985 [Zasmidium cellare ATCC 36951]KAF2171013.1 hypothetical protein M409DRAFT_18985 [Zasmidium cellare ATCC 36951]